MRGALSHCYRYRHPFRFIPAHAGSTSDISHVPSVYAVHPRACGEHYAPPLAKDALAGSSPRMRGARFYRRLQAQGSRFIPAHAGSTEFLMNFLEPVAVHPRACGEHLRYRAVGLLGAGSSPRMRGAHFHSSPSLSKSRFIPAHAGSTQLVDAGVDEIASHAQGRVWATAVSDRDALAQHIAVDEYAPVLLARLGGVRERRPGPAFRALLPVPALADAQPHVFASALQHAAYRRYPAGQHVRADPQFGGLDPVLYRDGH